MGTPGFGMNQREAAIAPFARHGTGVELKVSISWMMSSSVMPPLCRIGAWLSLSGLEQGRFEMPRPDCEKYRGQFNGDSILPCDDPASLLFLHPPRRYAAADRHCADGALPELLYGPGWEHVLVLVTGMVLAPGKRTVSAALRVMGLGETRDFALYHYVLSHARWNSRAIARTLLTMILDRFLPPGRW